MAMAIQQMPDWLRPLLSLLPASRSRSAVVGKPPGHMIERALGSLRRNNLPSERPIPKTKKSQTVGNKHRLDQGGDSSDDDDDAGNRNTGYSSQFRARQHARQQTMM
mmetsp:Transcript_8428/g.22812  ORF Transcript_8428/g.22812 Transcript_8428/m.22812 type:complete len:107 (-) Transcript_8428:219-539(-)